MRLGEPLQLVIIVPVFRRIRAVSNTLSVLIHQDLPNSLSLCKTRFPCRTK